MTCDFTSFLAVFQSYKDDGREIMKDCVKNQTHCNQHLKLYKGMYHGRKKPAIIVLGANKNCQKTTDCAKKNRLSEVCF